jgi:hypothetical protein
MVVRKLMIVLCLSVASLNAINRLYLENNYGGEIACKVNNRPDVIIGRGVRVFLGNIQLDKKTPLVWVKSLNIRTSGAWSGYGLTSFTSLDTYLERILWEQKLHCNTDRAACAKDAVIVINPSRIVSSWNISYHWQNVANITEFSMD